MAIPTTAPTTWSERESDARLEELQAAVAKKARARARQDAWLRVLAPLTTLIILLFAWDWAITAFAVPPYLVPSPGAVASAFVDDFPRLIAAARDTYTSVFIAWVVAIGLALLIALLAFHSKLFARGVYPFLVALQAVPKVAVGPLFALWFGFGIVTKAGMGVLIALFALTIAILVGLNSLPNEKILLARSIGLSPSQTFFKIRLPQALPSIFGGMKVAIALCAIGVIVGEFVGGSSGLGYLILTANHNLNTALLFAALSMMAAFSITLFVVIETVERIAIPWGRK
jgi:NitT/TauT family transport system permease protein